MKARHYNLTTHLLWCFPAEGIPDSTKEGLPFAVIGIKSPKPSKHSPLLQSIPASNLDNITFI